MLPVLVFQHVEHEGPGYLEEFLKIRGIPYSLVRIDAGESVPEGPEGASGLVFMGGYMSVNDPLPWVTAEVGLIRQALARDIPVLGHCLGGQLIARALGAAVSDNGVSEIGWHLTRRLANPVAGQWLRGVGDPLELFHWHSETFALPPGVQPILTSRFCENQGFVTGRTLALQCHIEMTAPLVRDWAERSRVKLVESESVQTADEMMRDLPSRIERLNKVADHVYQHWAAGLAA